MKIQLRPHHFLCLQGYKGINYTKAQANSWHKISNKLAQSPDTDVLIVSGRDDLCKNCPAILKKDNSRCIETNVNQLDDKVAQVLNLVTGKVYKYYDTVEKMKNIMTKQMHEKLCSDCAWWKKGLCRDSFNK